MTLRRAPVVVFVATALAATAAVIIAAATANGGYADGNFGRLPDALPWLLNMAAAAGVGAVIARTKPHNALAAAFAVGGLLGTVAVLGDLWATTTVHRGPGLQVGASVGAFLSTAGLYGAWALLAAVVPLAFPDGHLDTRLRRLAACAAVGGAVACASSAASPGLLSDAPFHATGARNALALPGLRSVAPLLFIGIVPLIGATAIGIGALVARFVRSTGVERQQLKVVAFTVVIIVTVAIVQANLQPIVKGTSAQGANHAIAILLFPLLPVGLGVAIVRYRLYDVDRVISRTVAYALLLALITALYATVVAVAGSFLGNGPASFAGALAVAVAFQPARQRLRVVANRMVFGTRASPYDIVTGLSRRMAHGVSLDDALPGLAEAAASGTRAVAARAEVLLADHTTRCAVWPEHEADRVFEPRVPIVHDGEEIGALGIALGQGQVLDATQRRLLDDLASHAGVALRNVQLATELERRLEELRLSRQRIVTAADAERKRVERNLHDGAQQRLVSAGLVLRLARGKAASGAADEADALLEEAAAELDRAQEELRDLARGIYPAVLVDGGLAPAVVGLAERSAVPVDVDVVDRRFPPELEAAAYFVVAEALTNVAKHARANAACVRICADAGRLVVQVTDDGSGAIETSNGSGLRGLADRVAAHDGVLTVAGTPGKGTTVRAELPCA